MQRSITEDAVYDANELSRKAKNVHSILITVTRQRNSHTTVKLFIHQTLEICQMPYSLHSGHWSKQNVICCAWIAICWRIIETGIESKITHNDSPAPTSGIHPIMSPQSPYRRTSSNRLIRGIGEVYTFQASVHCTVVHISQYGLIGVLRVLRCKWNRQRRRG